MARAGEPGSAPFPVTVPDESALLGDVADPAGHGWLVVTPASVQRAGLPSLRVSQRGCSVFRSRLLNFLAAEVSATASGRFGVFWIASVLLAFIVFGLTLAWAVGNLGWVLGLPLALVAGFLSGGASFWGVIFFLALMLDALSSRPGLLRPSPDPPPSEAYEGSAPTS